jgi:wyosine [tRNA(Phe)-imidazoG37] synthetase (radical SAM superfamily)
LSAKLTKKIMNVYTSSVYGPVKSWRYGQSLGIDPIGSISTCSFNCVYCQLGEIEQKTLKRQVFVTNEQILTDLSQFDFTNVDVITLSGSGEPTLALNLGEIIKQIKVTTGKPILVLTNGTLLTLPEVRQELSLADKVSVKLDGVDSQQLTRIDRPVPELNWLDLVEGIKQFAREYAGEMSVQTMVLTPWESETINKYIAIISELAPVEIQLNLPHRPKPLKYQRDARGNHSPADTRSYEVRKLKCVSGEIIKAIADTITENTKIPVRLPNLV